MMLMCFPREWVCNADEILIGANGRCDLTPAPLFFHNCNLWMYGFLAVIPAFCLQRLVLVHRTVFPSWIQMIVTSAPNWSQKSTYFYYDLIFILFCIYLILSVGGRYIVDIWQICAIHLLFSKWHNILILTVRQPKQHLHPFRSQYNFS